MREQLMGNEAMGLAAIHAGVNVVSGYPGTPSTEVLESVAKHNTGDVYVEWSTNEKVALEVAAGASYAGGRVLVTMKQMGLNVAADPLMCLSYIGVNGGMVILVADDPGPISSQTEQDTRHFAKFANLPILDPSTPEEAYQMMYDAFEISERFKLPVILRPTTRVCHAWASIEPNQQKIKNKPEGFVKDPKWVIFPRLSYQKHKELEEKQLTIAQYFSKYPLNKVEGKGSKAIFAGGVSYTYAKEAIKKLNIKVQLIKISTPYPFPTSLVKENVQGVKEVLVVEELDDVIEEALRHLCYELEERLEIYGKRTQTLPHAGEYTYEIVEQAIAKFVGIDVMPVKPANGEQAKGLPVRPPVLCAGCPHRASFYAVKDATKDMKAYYTGDIGCYTLGNASPLNMVDTCLCMGANITVAQGLKRIEPDAKTITFTGDSTFFHTGLPGLANAVYNQTDITVVILDNATTAMTGHQPHPGTGQTMMGEMGTRIDIEKVVSGLGVEWIKKVDPLSFEQAVKVVKEATDYKGVSVIIFESPCIAKMPTKEGLEIKSNCKQCKICIDRLGCPAMSLQQGEVKIESSLCQGCTLCAQVCPFDAIGGKDHV